MLSPKGFGLSVLLSVLLVSHTVYAQNKDTALISITNFKLFPGTHSWRGTNTFHDMTSWDTSPYTDGNLKQQSGSNWLFRLNYRLLFPVGYDKNYKPGYPIIMMLHGAGERGNCWDNNCYCKGCNPNATLTQGADPRYLNNDHVLLHGGRQHLTAVNLAGSKKPDNPTLHDRAFPGFVFFPQNESGWGSASANNSAISYALRALRLLMKEYNIDPNRVYIHGLSAGGQGVLKALNMADWLFASAAVMSPIPYTHNVEYDSIAHIPIWVFQGGLDKNPTPGQTEAFLKRFRQAGGVARYTFYPERGHNTWNAAYSEPDFFLWFLSRTHNQIHVAYGNPNVCATSGEGAKLMLPEGFPAYQWEYNGQIISDAKGAVYIAKESGVYRARYSRKSSTPSEGEWNDWSDPVTIEGDTPPMPEITQWGTTYLRDLNDERNARLSAPPGYTHYYWYKNGSLANLEDSSFVEVSPGNCGTPCINTGRYTLITAKEDNCPSFPSPAKYLFFENQAPVKNNMRPSSFQADQVSSTGCFLKWNNPTSEEDAFEIWRKNTSLADSKWEMVVLTSRDATFFYDSALLPNSTYFYKIRALSSTARSDYFPGNDKTKAGENLVVKTSNDNTSLLPPQNLTAGLTGVNTITLTWEMPSGTAHLKEFIILYDGQSVRTGSTAKQFTVTGLSVNKTYQFTVRAVNHANQQSPPSNQVSISTQMHGLFYKHSTGAWESLDDPSLKETWDSPEETGFVSNITLTPRVQDDYFNFQFEGYLYITTAGLYTFYLNSSDGSRLYIDNALIVDFDGLHNTCTGGPSSTTCPNNWGRPGGPVTLTAGPHYIKVQMFDYVGPEALSVRYNGPDTGNGTILIPSSAFTSGNHNAPPAPPAPTNLLATAKGMTQIDLSWHLQNGANVEYEIYRSTKPDTEYRIINRINQLTYTDDLLNPGTTYYYRVRSANNNGVSSFTNTANAKTVNDTEAPTQPTGLTISSVAATNVNLVWDPSTDNVGVAGYEVWMNDKMIGTTPVTGFKANFNDAQIYTFYVVAFDVSGNRSPSSAPVTLSETPITGAENGANANFSVSVFPNPAPVHDINVKLISQNHEDVSLEILDMLGRSVYRQTFDANFLRDGVKLPVRSVITGMYILVVRQEKNLLERKLVIRD